METAFLGQFQKRNVDCLDIPVSISQNEENFLDQISQYRDKIESSQFLKGNGVKEHGGILDSLQQSHGIN